MSFSGFHGLLSAAASVEVDFNPQLVLAQLAMLTLLFIVLQELLFKPLIKTFEARDRRTTGAIHDARVADNKAAEILREIEGELAEVHRVASDERDKVRAEVSREEAKILAEAREDVARQVEDGRKRIREEAQALEFAMGQSANEYSREVATRVLGREVQ